MERTVGYSVKALSNQIRRLLDNRRPANWDMDEKLTSTQFGVLGFVGFQSAYRDVFQRDVEAEFHIRRSTATGILQLMEKNGLIRREPVAHDARLKKLVLTPRAQRIHQQIAVGIQEAEEILTRGISREELDTFFAVIDKMIDNLSE